MADCHGTGAGQGERRLREVDSGHSETGRLEKPCSKGERRAGRFPEKEAGVCGENWNVDGHNDVGFEHAGKEQHPVSRMGNSNEQGLEGRGERGERAGELSARQASPWNEYDIVHCRDGRQRRIPKGSVESGIQCMVDGIQPGMDTLWHQGYPLAWQKIESRPAILKGIGNAINPYIAAEFIRAYMQAELLTQQNNQLP